MLVSIGASFVGIAGPAKPFGLRVTGNKTPLDLRHNTEATTSHRDQIRTFMLDQTQLLRRKQVDLHLAGWQRCCIKKQLARSHQYLCPFSVM